MSSGFFLFTLGLLFLGKVATPLKWCMLPLPGGDIIKLLPSIDSMGFLFLDFDFWFGVMMWLLSLVVMLLLPLGGSTAWDVWGRTVLQQA